MAFRVVCPGPLGEVTSLVIEDLEGARLIADALASYMDTVCVIDTETNKTVYSRRRKAETSAHEVGGRLSARRPFFFNKLTDHIRFVWSLRPSAIKLNFSRLHSRLGRH